MLIYVRPEAGGYNLAGYHSGGSQMLGGKICQIKELYKTPLTQWPFAQWSYSPIGKHFWTESWVKGRYSSGVKVKKGSGTKRIN